MPELPEVETIKRDLDSRVLNKKIKTIWIEPSFSKKILPSTEEFLNLIGKQFKKLNRKAKLLYFETNDNRFLLCHLKMTGQLVYRSETGKTVSGGHAITSVDTVPNKFTRVVFTFKDKSKLYFNDLRKFGYFKFTNNNELEKELSKYGIDALDRKMDFAMFTGILQKRKNYRIKQFLLTQDLISGLGNIYADEALFASGIRPMRRIMTLKKAEKEKLFHSIKNILRLGIEHGGTSVNTYVNGTGTKGDFQNLLKVYGKSGEPCSDCGTIIKKIKLAGRTASFCARCQK